MLIVWGEKIRRDRRGFCANYCGLCKEPVAFEVTDLYKVSHLYYISLGSGELTATELKCTACGNEMTLQPMPDIPVQPGRDDLESMLADVPPDVQKEWQEQREKDRVARENPEQLSKEDRLDQVAQSFANMENKVASAIAEGVKVDGAMMLGFGAWVLLLLFFIFLGEHLVKLGVISSLMQSTGLDGFGLGMVTMLVSGVAILIWATATYKSRYFKKNVYPQLATSLAPLRPTHDELESVRTMLKSNGLQMGKVNLDKLEAAILERQGR